MSITINIVNISDVNSVEAESFVNGDSHSIKIWNGFDFGNLLMEICHIMKEEEFNCERILFYTKEGKRFEFSCDDVLLNNGDYFNVAIIEDNYEQMTYAHDTAEDETESTIRRRRKVSEQF